MSQRLAQENICCAHIALAREDHVRIGRTQTSNFPCHESFSRGQLKSKGGGQLSIHHCADLDSIETIFRTIVSVNQLSLYGYLRDMWRVWSPSRKSGCNQVPQLVLNVIKTEVLLNSDDQDLQLQQFGGRIEKFSQHHRLSQICMDAGFLNVVEIGHYFMKKEFSQLTDAVACREYTLPRHEEASQPKGTIQEDTKIGPVLEVATCCLYGINAVEIWIWSVNRDNTHSSVRISLGLNKLVTNLSHNEQNIQKFSSNNMRKNWMRKILHAD